MVAICVNKELIKKSAAYFDNNSELNEIYVSGDGQFFYKVNKAGYHLSVSGEKLYKVTREMAKPKPKEKPAPKTTKKPE